MMKTPVLLSNKNTRNILLWVFITLPLFALARKAPRLEAPLSEVKESGFHRIILTPEVSMQLNSSFSDLRLYSDEGEETPYLLSREPSVHRSTYFKTYEITELKHIKFYRRHWGNCTYLILHNPEKSKINNINLRIKNADVQKRLELSGSNDGKLWYAIKDDYVFESIYDHENTCEVKILNFPYSDYEYYRIVISDRSSDPINILEAGYYDTYAEEGRYQVIPNPQIQQWVDTLNQTTRVKVTFPGTPYADQMKFYLDGPAFFQRNAKIGKYVEVSRGRRRKKKQKQFVTLHNITLGSNRDNQIDMGLFAEKEFWIIIENRDNPPLKIDSIRARQRNTYLDAYLEEGHRYALQFGAKSMRKPNYDLGHFRDEIPKAPPLLSLGVVHSIKKHSIIPVTEPTNEVYIWIGIVVLAGILGWVSLGMVKDMSRKENESSE